MDDRDLAKQNIDEYLERHYHKELLRFVTVGSVDDGKSTLIGRLLFDTESVYDDQLEALKKTKGSVEGDELDYSLLLDGLTAEREQGITIDVAYRYFATNKRKFIIADTPGHIQYTRNMATGASNADLALILVDARLGILPQSRRHATIASMLGISHLVVCVNKMDLRQYSQEVFEQIQKDFKPFLKQLRFKDVSFFPVSALKGDNIVTASKNTPWFKGGTLLQHLEEVPIPKPAEGAPLCFPIQYVLRPNLNFRGYCGTLASGVMRKGDEILVLPSGKKSRVKSIVTYQDEIAEAFSPMAITLTLEDELDISRGDTIVSVKAPLGVSRHVRAKLVWLSENSLDLSASYWIKQTTRLVSGMVSQVNEVLDVTTLTGKPQKTLELNDIGEVELQLSRPLVLDSYEKNRAAGAFILIDRVTNATVAAGMVVSFKSENADEVVLDREVSPEERVQRFGHKPCVVNFVGHSGSGKMILARALERRLFESGVQSFVLDHDRLPHIPRILDEAGLEALIGDLKLCQRMGVISLVAFTALSADHREKMKEHFEGGFVEVYVEAKKATCQKRVESLGRPVPELDLPFEVPSSPDFKVVAEEWNLEREVDRLIELLTQKKIFV